MTVKKLKCGVAQGVYEGISRATEYLQIKLFTPRDTIFTAEVKGRCSFWSFPVNSSLTKSIHLQGSTQDSEVVKASITILRDVIR